MKPIEKTYLQMVSTGCHSDKDDCNKTDLDSNKGHDNKTGPGSQVISDEMADELLELAKRQYTVPLLLEYLKNTSCFEDIRRQAKMMMFNYYQIEQFTFKTAQLLEEHHISYILLKGISLASCYPVPEYRKLGDLDILILDTEKLELVQKILLEHHYEPEKEESDHHLTYFYRFANGRRHMLELHYRIVGFYQYVPANRVIEHVFSPQHLQPVWQSIEGRDYPLLPPTEYTFYMLHHMLKHYLYDGFGIRLLCDFSLYVEKNRQNIDFRKLNEWCRESGMDYFCATVVASCKAYLGLPHEVPGMISVSADECDQFVTQILEGHDVGNEKQSSLVYSGSYRKVNLLAYFKEGHTQMKVRFPKLCRCILLWPVLWGLTFWYFIKNTYTVRNTTLRQTIKAFKADNQRTQKLHIFENKDL